MIGLLVGTLREFKSDDTERSQTKQVFDSNTKNTLGVKKSLIIDSIIESCYQNFFTPIVSYQFTTSKITHI